MKYIQSTYGDYIAPVYDIWPGLPADADAAVGFLEARVGAGPVLECGVGTGRIALRLADRGVAVDGIDASAAMIDTLKSKIAGRPVTPILGDFSGIDLGRRYGLIYLIYNTFFEIQSAADQHRCLANVARHMHPEGVLVMECFVPEPGRYPGGQRVGINGIDPDQVFCFASLIDAEQQASRAMQMQITDGGIRLYPLQRRYVFPAELDLMCLAAGLHLLERWGGWLNEPFERHSTRHVSVYRRDRASSGTPDAIGLLRDD